ncbi:adenosylmethionine decarboxylase [uncultured Shewanella sp.]|uniref:adenosylmethionine decarboxylase n=1 Tax=uncultured Shewanella sp. TaxID=173975 RepID=UPI0026232D5D|nr:adenosylmethionine decarboxylase [uncultured Shewanella sp.]
MFFEGTEKKITVRVSDKSPSLRRLDCCFWARLVSFAGANILSQISTTQCDAYLLSESSLFVWDKHFLMLTCGDSTLVDSLKHFITQVDADAVIKVRYFRRNEFMPALQQQHFFEDVKHIEQIMVGQSYRIGHLDSHHQYVFSANQALEQRPVMGCELVMYHIQGEFATNLRSGSVTAEDIRARLGGAQLFIDFEIDDHCFSPSGYSINGVCAAHYFTIHITPQAQSSYVSFETNLDDTHYSVMVAHLLSLFSPKKWDVLTYNVEFALQTREPAFCVMQSQLALSHNEKLFFYQYQVNNTEVFRPYAL